MSVRAAKIDSGVSISLVVSTVIHLAVFLLLVWSGRLFPTKSAIQETYYVDVLTLPVANPQSGASTQNLPEAAAAVPPLPKAAMKLPSKTAPKADTKSANKAAPEEAAETESAFAERMARLERNSEARHEEAVLEKLRNKLKTGATTKIGTPGATGAEAGSRYADYIKSRLEDALEITNSYTSKNPEVAVRLTISADGKLSRMKIERSSGDVTFELAVRRAIDLASSKFTAPPNRTVFENGFVFKPKGISKGLSR